jgi:two-component system sensor histidine kinase RegB
MWLNFAISAALIAFYLVRMANTVQEQREQLDKQREQLNRQREQALRNQQILGLATLAAGTAHELGTPLNSIQILLDDLDATPNPQDIDLLKQQVQQCKKIIGQLARTAELHQQETLQTITLADFLQRSVADWQLLRPQAHYSLNLDNLANSNPLINTDTTLSQALCNLLNNAADAVKDSTSNQIEISALANDTQCQIQIRDHGPGFSAHVAEKIGQPFISEKESGMGLGIYLSQATIERFGGHIELANHSDGGAIVTVTLPIVNVENNRSAS